MTSQYDRKTSFPYRKHRNPCYCHSNMCGTNRISITIAWPILMLSFKLNWIPAFQSRRHAKKYVLALILDQRIEHVPGIAWTLRTGFSGFKAPKPLKYGANLQDWQLFNSDDNTIKNLSAFAPIQGAKLLDEWLLISEKISGSTAHVDVGYATWVSCLAGKKDFSGFETHQLTIYRCG